jgi:hypothetical protein
MSFVINLLIFFDESLFGLWAAENRDDNLLGILVPSFVAFSVVHLP